MLLRRVIEHVKAQSWTAVFLDFVIVVVGVFIGLQAANWNNARSAKIDFEQAVQRFQDETQTNLETLAAREPEIAAKNAAIRKAIDALQSCVDNDANKAAVEDGINHLKWSYGLQLRRGALDELTTAPHLMARQSDAQRRRLAEAKHNFDIFLAEAHFLETDPLSVRAEENPIIGVGPAVDQSVNYLGVDYFSEMRLLTLEVPVSVACKDGRLLKDFFSFEYRQSALPGVAAFLKTELEKNREAFSP